MSLFVNKLLLATILYIGGLTISILAYQPSVKTVVVGVTVAMATVSATMLYCHLRSKHK